MVLQALYGLSDDQAEFQIQDRLSFMRFLGLGLGDRVPDAKTIWLFREHLTQPELPEGWAWATLGQLFDVTTGSTPSRADPTLWNGSVPWVSSGEVAFCRIRSTRETITSTGLGNPQTKASSR
jgi:hypothetical protein